MGSLQQTEVPGNPSLQPWNLTRLCQRPPRRGPDRCKTCQAGREGEPGERAQDFALHTTQDFALHTTQDFALHTTQDLRQPAAVGRPLESTRFADNARGEDFRMDTETHGSPSAASSGTRERAKWFSIVVAVMPLFLFVFLSIVNPGYMSTFFAAETRTLGLSILGLVTILSFLSFVLLRGSLSIFRSGRRLLSMVLTMAVMGAIGFPAVLLVVLGPAALILLAAEL